MNSHDSSRRRERIIFILILSGMALIVARLVSIQLLGHAFWEARAETQELAWIKHRPARGNILDCEGRHLAISLPLTYAIGYRPDKCPDKPLLQKQLEPLLGKLQKNLKASLHRDVKFTYLARRVDWRTAENIRALDAPSIELVEEPRRSYPNDHHAASVIGFANIDQEGQEGIELEFDKQLRGRIARELVWLDIQGKTCMPLSDEPVNSNRGTDIQLTIDIALQAIIEEELQKAMQTQECQRACIILTNPQTGEILALATYPGFNPNTPGLAIPAARKCWPIMDVMEHGSTLKILPFAGTLSRNLFDINDTIFCENGHFPVRGAVIHDAHAYGYLTFAEILHRSSNIGAVKIAQRLGKEGLYETARRFGFGNQTDISFPGEQSGYLPPPYKWSGPSLANIAFGHGISATPLQVVMAYGAIANGGYLMKPRLIKRVYHPSGEIEETKPTIIRQALSTETARRLSELLVGVVEKGTGKTAAIPDYNVAGKTGTGQKINHKTKRYYRDRFISSFVGFAPAEAPCYLMLVLIDDPQEQYYASQVAAPIFRNAMARILECRPQTPIPSPFPKTASSPDYRPEFANSPSKGAAGTLQSCSFTPTSNRILPADENKGAVTGYVEVPHIEGLPFRHAIRELTNHNLAFHLSGHRKVICQNPPPGSIVPIGTICNLIGLSDQ